MARGRRARDPAVPGGPGSPPPGRGTHRPHRPAAMALGRLLLLLMAVSPGTAATKDCYFCEVTDARTCPSTHMTCSEEEDCFTGYGVAPGVGAVTNKGCVRTTSCGHEQPISYMGVTYSLVTSCCVGDLCNAAPRPPDVWTAGVAPGLALSCLLLLLQ